MVRERVYTRYRKRNYIEETQVTRVEREREREIVLKYSRG